ncbi:MAG: hypothetical protein JKY56_07905 [Kofleriaceae bacterium]|nr:hypothetical protein [Kofleriaceae bacterium]
MPSHKLAEAPILFTPPDLELAWTELIRFPPGDGWHSVKAGLPTQVSDWTAITKALVVTHDAGQGLSISWLPTKEGDLQQGDYIWQDSTGFHRWTFIAPNTLGAVTYPETPDRIILAELPTIAIMDLNVHDYNDVDGYGMALDANRAAWGNGPPDSFFESGGTLSSSTLFSVSSSENRELNEVLDHLAPHSTHIRLVAPLAKASRAEGLRVRLLQ